MEGLSVHSCLSFIWNSRSKGGLIIIGDGKECGHKKGSSCVAYDDNYCDGF